MKQQACSLVASSGGAVRRRVHTVAAALAIGLGGISVAAAGPQLTHAAANPIYVHTALGGFILGYDIDQNSREGLLAEAFDLPDGKADVAVESFDQTTGNARIIFRQNDTKSAFVVWGIYGQGTGLAEYEHVSDLYVDKRLYATLHPKRRWTPPLVTSDLISGIAPSQGAAGTAVLYSDSADNTYVFGADVTANAFGSVIELSDPVFSFNNQPQIGIDTATNQAVVASSNGGLFDLPTIALADLTTGAVTEFQGIGYGGVMGIAVDSKDGIVVTTSFTDYSVEFYNLATQQGFEVPMKNCANEVCAGDAVAYDPVNHLFLVGQTYSSVGGSTGAIQVFDVNDNYVEGITNLDLPASPLPINAKIALNPRQRTGFVYLASETELESFTY